MTSDNMGGRLICFGSLFVLMLFVSISGTACSPEVPNDKIRIGGNSPTGFYAGATAVSITPTILETFKDFDYSADETGSVAHIGPDGRFNGTLANAAGEPGSGIEGFVDSNGNGVFDAVWLAGSFGRRPANDIHDDLWARAVVMRSGERTLAIVSLDAIGYFNDEVRKIREAVQAKVELEHVIVVSTHSHETPDVVGIWGPDEGIPGWAPEYLALVRRRAIKAVIEAAKAAGPVELHVASGSVVPPQSGQQPGNMYFDARDPVVIDDQVGAIQFRSPGGSTEAVVATLVNWSGHPEHMIDGNAVSSDYPHYLRLSLEDSFRGSTALFVNGVIGGQIGTNHATVIRGDRVYKGAAGVRCREEGHAYQVGLMLQADACPPGYTVGDKKWMWDKAEAVGHNVADRVVDLLATADVAQSPRIDVFSKDVFLPIENLGYKLMFLVGAFVERVLFKDAEGEEAGELAAYHVQDTWFVRTDVQRVDFRTSDGVLVQILTVPGEMHPELAVGGWDGTKTGGIQPFVQADNPNPPFPKSADGWDTSGAPDGPYLRDKMGGKHNFFFGLANDELGYFIPSFNWELHGESPYLEEAPGDHYEETNSLGPETAQRLMRVYDELLSSKPAAD